MRYADDFIIGVIGTRKDAELVKSFVRDWFKTHLKLKVREEKTKITEGNKGFEFLGFYLYIGTRKFRTYTRAVGLTGKSAPIVKVCVLPSNLIKNLLEGGLVKQRFKDHESFWPCRSKRLQNFKHHYIVKKYNEMWREVLNSQGIADGKKGLKQVGYVFYYSLLFTLAHKFKCRKGEITETYGLNLTSKSPKVRFGPKPQDYI